MAKVGRPFTYTAERLQSKYIEYLEYMSTQYDIKVDFVKSGERAGDPIEIKLPKIKSIRGFCVFADIEYTTFYNYVNGNSDNVDEHLMNTITRIQGELLEYRASLGLNNIINPNLLMAIDGIKQTIDVQQTVTLNSLPMHLDNNIIDLTSSDFTILNENVNESGLQLTE